MLKKQGFQTLQSKHPHEVAEMKSGVNGGHDYMYNKVAKSKNILYKC